jgi:hypothetical protein
LHVEGLLPTTIPPLSAAWVERGVAPHHDSPSVRRLGGKRGCSPPRFPLCPPLRRIEGVQGELLIIFTTPPPATPYCPLTFACECEPGGISHIILPTTNPATVAANPSSKLHPE